MSFLLEPNQDVVELLRIQLGQHGVVLHDAGSLDEARRHLLTCPHDAVLVGGHVDLEQWDGLYASIRDGAKVTYWTSRAGSDMPLPPVGRGLRTRRLLGVPLTEHLVRALLPPDVPARRDDVEDRRDLAASA